MEEKRRKPFKICNSERTKTQGIVAESLKELKERGSSKLGIVAGSCRVFLDSDGTEIDDEEYFSFLEDQTKLMIVFDGEDWTAGLQNFGYSQGSTELSISSAGASLETNESMEFDRTDAGETDGIPPDLLIRMKNDPAFFISFSDERLQDVINIKTDSLATVMGRSVIEAEHIMDTCQQELDRRAQLREATQLLKLLQRAQENQASENESQSAGNKRLRTSTE
ncbi:DNA fragmentation factor subunit alpha [Stylophora pistillata]|uniref:DNAation factor subunit alpha n=2 Tax=Stylophora pistillata TaxID=50429 RepID=A0A2B4RSE7_STYPI|nr:DNA fragmentation factor subunit alpha [Stylophora pistillata]